MGAQEDLIAATPQKGFGMLNSNGTFDQGLAGLQRDRKDLQRELQRIENRIKGVDLAIKILSMREDGSSCGVRLRKRGEPFRVLVLEALSERPGVPHTVGGITRKLAERVRFGKPYRTDLRGRVAVELSSMTRSRKYKVRRVDQGEYVYYGNRPKK